MRFFTLLATVVSCFLSVSARASIVENQFPTMITTGSAIEASVFNFQPLGPLGYAGWRAVSAFRGDGNNLNSVEIYCFRQGIGVIPNEGNLSETDFRLSFWNEESALLADPRLNSPGPEDRAFLFDTPANTDWQTPAFMYGVFEVFYFRFDLSALEIATTPGQRHFLAITPQGLVGPSGSGTGSGNWYILGSTGGPGSVGSEDPAWRWAFNGGSPAPLPSGRPEIAARITTIPAPSSLVPGLLVFAFSLRRWRE